MRTQSNTRMMAVVSALAVTACGDEPPECEEWRTSIDTDEESSLVPFSMDEVLADLSTLEGTVTWNPAAPTSVAGTETQVRVETTIISGTIYEVEAKDNGVQGDSAFLCSDHLEAEVVVVLTSDDDQLSEEFETTLEVWADDSAPGYTRTGGAQIEPTDLVGSLSLSPEPTSYWFSMSRALDKKLTASVGASYQEESEEGVPGRSQVIPLWTLTLE